MEFEDLKEFDKFEPVLRGCSGRVRWSAANSIEHLKGAATLIPIDQNMALFRAVCAEEEAATSLICCLQLRKYAGAKSIQFRNHSDKHAVISFIKCFIHWFENSAEDFHAAFNRPTFFLKKLGKRSAIAMSFPIRAMEGSAMQPLPPLNVQAQQPGVEGSAWATILRGAMDDIFGTTEVDEIREAIKTRANFRNTLLYATNNGIPNCKIDVAEFIKSQARTVHYLLVVLGLIDPWRKPEYEQAPIVTAAIAVFLEVMGRIDKKV